MRFNDKSNPQQWKNHCTTCEKPVVSPEDWGDYDDACEWACTCPSGYTIWRLETDAEKLEKNAMIQGLSTPTGKLYWAHAVLLKAIVAVNLRKTHRKSLLKKATKEAQEAVRFYEYQKQVSV